MPDEPAPIGLDIEAVLNALLTRQNLPPEWVERIEALRRQHAEAVLELMKRREAAYGELFAYEVSCNVTCGYSEDGAQKIAHNDLAFFRVELERELREAINREDVQLRERIRRLLEEAEDEGLISPAGVRIRQRRGRCPGGIE